MPFPPLDRSRPLRYAVFFALYAMVWLPAGFSGTALYNFLTARKVAPEVVGGFIALTGLPWAFQFVWGPVIDRFQGSAMGRRRPWLLGSLFLTALVSLGLLAVTDPVAEVGLLGAMFFALAVCGSLQDTSADALAITVVPDEERGRVTGFMRAGGLFGVGVGAAGGAKLLHEVGFRDAAAGLSVVLLTFGVLMVFVRERPGDALFPWSRPAGPRGAAPRPAPELGVLGIFARAFGGLTAPRSLVVFGAAAAAYLAANVSYKAFTNALLRNGDWDDAELSVLTGLLATVVPMAVVLAGGAVVDRLGHRRMLVGVMVVLGAGLVAWNLQAGLWGRKEVATGVLVAWSVFDPMISVTAMPLLMAICRRGVEGSQFTAYMALINLTDVAGQYVNGWAVGLMPAPAIGLCCGLMVLVAAAGLALIAPPRPDPSPVPA